MHRRWYWLSVVAQMLLSGELSAQQAPGDLCPDRLGPPLATIDPYGEPTTWDVPTARRYYRRFLGIEFADTASTAMICETLVLHDLWLVARDTARGDHGPTVYVLMKDPGDRPMRFWFRVRVVGSRPYIRRVFPIRANHLFHWLKGSMPHAERGGV